MGRIMQSFHLRLTVFTCVGLLLAGCHALPKSQEGQASSWQVHQQTLSAIHSWDIAGKFAFHKDKTTLGSFDWEQKGEQFSLHFVGPLSVGSARMQGDNKRVSFRQQDKEALLGDSPETLLKEHMGWEMPLSPMRYWVKGQLAPGKDAKILWDKQQHLRSIKQLGWEVILTDYVEQKGKVLPTRLTMKRGDVWVKLVIKSWQWGV